MQPEVCAAELPAFALFGEDGELIRTTESFRRWRGELPAEREELSQVLSGERDRAGVSLEGATVQLEAVVDATDSRRVLASVVPHGVGDPADPIAVVAEQLAGSPAIAWLKDLESRHLFVNSPYTDQLGTSAERIRGRRDDELSPRETVDGPRALGGIAAGEPIELEYTVAPFEGRPALAVLRFAVRDREQQVVATCGVAAPLADSHLAESECLRLLQLERLCRLDPATARAEMLADWSLATDVSPASNGQPLVRGTGPGEGAGVASHVVEVETAPTVPTGRDRPRHDEHGQIAELREASAAAEMRVQELSAELQAARAELADKSAVLDAARAELAERSSALDAARAELEQANCPSARPPFIPPTAPPPVHVAAPASTTAPPPPTHAPPVPAPIRVPPQLPPRRGLLARLAGRGRR